MNGKPLDIDLQKAQYKIIPDIVAPYLTVLFCGINPGLYTAAVGYHFGRPGNRFWKTLHAAGFTPRLFHPSEQADLLPLGYGITNLVARASATAAEISDLELIAGGIILEQKVIQLKPRWLAVVGIDSYRIAFQKPRTTVGDQLERIGDTKIWVLPNPSGLNAHYNLPKLVQVFSELYKKASQQ